MPPSQAEGVKGFAVLAIIKMLAFTGARKSEITRLMWSEVDLDHRCLRLAESKTGPKILPLGPPALELLSGLFVERDAEWVFPSRDKRKPFTGLEKTWDRVRNLAGYTGSHELASNPCSACSVPVRGSESPSVGGRCSARLSDAYQSRGSGPLGTDIRR
jgi:site-specific recombinase XerD